MNKQEKEVFYELLLLANKQDYEAQAMPSAVDNELRDLVEKASHDSEVGFICRHLSVAMEEVEKTEKAYLAARNVYQARVRDALDILER